MPLSEDLRRCPDLEERKAECHRVLRDTFGHTHYKGKQKQIIEAAVTGYDVFILAPTGFGKSLCFQIPAASDKVNYNPSGVTVVISPLLALINNQVTSLRKKGVLTHALTSETSKSTRQEVYDDLVSENPAIRLVYMAPERLKDGECMHMFKIMYQNGTLNRLVVDEAHCISEWGHDFRGDYRRLGAFRRNFKDIPIMALTATATSEVIHDIISSLGMSQDNLYKVIHPFNRANLYYEVRYRSGFDQLALMSEICDYIFSLHRKRGKPSSGIIYCRRRNTCNEVSAFLRGKGLSAKAYHRKLPPSELEKTFREWAVEGGSANGGLDVVVATVAFGLGIDKGDVRYVIHYDCPTSLEGYYQETGRAGRNGSPSKCILYYTREDAAIAKKLVAQGHTNRIVAAEEVSGPAPSQRAVSSLDALVKMAENTRLCRHVSICRYFGEIINTDDKELLKSLCDNMCDVCKYPEKTRRQKDKLSSKEWAASQVENRQFGNEDDSERPLYKSNNTNANSLSNTKSAAKPGSGSYFGTKRMMDGVGNSESAAKKPKVSSGLTTTLVTKPFSSASILTKPFKTPLMKTTSTLSNSSGPRPPPKQTTAPKATWAAQKPTSSPDIEPKHEDDHETSVRTQEEEDEAKFAVPQRASSPVDLPDVLFELEEPTTEKIPASLLISTSRREGVDQLRMALYKVMKKNPELWSRFKRAPSNTERRDRIIALTAKEIEYDFVLCFSSSLEGYKERIRVNVASVEMMAHEKAWNGCQEEEYEDVQQFIGAMEKICKIA
ncbi:hypothetical protein D9758_013147 [Tetrapyrgos nigripes]|uniref:ATP-dependent DNA helicase n=1 Tax=Tetrapyrgos nigripes TaxID=182062 RepID=A0A8H5CE42_9AGAR|nr:hypothetical protein D9758_013147 [Tetrapyrgos nigripes]